MNENDTIVTNRFVLNRIPSFFEDGPVDTADTARLIFLFVIGILALVYMSLMYYRDSRTIGGLWASLLGFLRFCVYGLLVFFYLQPMIKKEEQTISRSKAVLLFDTSLSMIEIRDPAENPAGAVKPDDPLKQPSRQDKVLNFLNDDKLGFMKLLTAKNDLTLYRFGSNLDPNYWHLTRGRFYTRVEREDPVVNFTNRRGIAAPMPQAFMTAWLKAPEHLETDRMIWFMLTDESLDALAKDVETETGNKELTNALVAKLKTLKDKEFLGRAEFVKALTTLLGKDDEERFQETILVHADRDLFEITDESLANVDASITAAKDEEKAQLTKLKEKLDGLKDKEFVGRAKFVREFNKGLDKAAVENFQNRVLVLANRGSAPTAWDKAKRYHFNDLAKENSNTYAKNMAFDGTNIYQSLTKTLEDEQKTRTRAIVLFSDGRSNLGDLRDFDKNLDSGTAEEWQKKRSEKIEFIRNKAKEYNIPIIVVGIGPKPKAKATIVDPKETKELVRIFEVEGLRHPKQVQPEDSFRVVADVRGDGQPDVDFDARLEITKVRIEPKEVMEDGKKVIKPVETELDMALVEQRPPPKRDPSVKEPPKEEKKAALAVVPLGKKLILPAVPKPRLDTSFKPRAAVEFEIDPGILAKLRALGIEVDLTKFDKTEAVADVLKKALERSTPQAMKVILESMTEDQLKDLVVEAQPDEGFQEAARATDAKRLKSEIVALAGNPGAKWGLGVSKPDKGQVKEEYRFKVIVNKHPLDTWPNQDHLHKSGGLRVQKKPLSVLLFTSSASKDYQFLREVLIRETQKDLARLTIVLQTNNRNEVREPGVVQGVPENRFLSEFPSTYKPDVAITSYDSEEAINNLASYDVIVAIDPDWTRLKEKTGEDIKTWVGKGGGLIVLGGPLFTKRLARPGDHAKKLQPIIDLLPVVLKDIDTVNTERKPDSPWPLEFDQATSELEFLRLSEEPGNFLDTWDKIYGVSKDTKSGKYNGFYSFYPVLKTTPTSQVIARFGDPEAKTDTLERMPYFVISAPSSPERVIWIGSSETWRLRQAKEVYHERFWTKLLRYAGANTQVKVNKSVKLEPLGGPYTKNDLIRIEAKVVDSNGKGVSKDKLTLKLRTHGQGVEEAVPLKLLEQAMESNEKKAGVYYVAPFSLPKQGTYDVEVSNESGETDKGTFDIREYNVEKEDARPDFDTLYNLASKAEVVKYRDGMSETKYKELTAALEASRPKMEGGDEKAIDPDERRLFFDLTNADKIPDCIDKVEKKEKRPEVPEDLRELAFGERFVLTDASFDRLKAANVPKGVLNNLTDIELKDKTFYTLAAFEKELDKALVGLPDKERDENKKKIVEEAAGYWVAKSGKTILSMVLLVVVGLLSLEWLIRKLLRLA